MKAIGTITLRTTTIVMMPKATIATFLILGSFLLPTISSVVEIDNFVALSLNPRKIRTNIEIKKNAKEGKGA